MQSISQFSTWSITSNTRLFLKLIYALAMPMLLTVDPFASFTQTYKPF